MLSERWWKIINSYLELELGYLNNEYNSNCVFDLSISERFDGKNMRTSIRQKNFRRCGFTEKQDSKELSPRPLENAPKLLTLIKPFKLLVFYWIQNFNTNDGLKTLDAKNLCC